jgi:hypothetical protein
MYRSATLMRRNSLEAVDGYDEDLDTYEDWDLYLRLSLQGSLEYLDYPAARYRKWEGNVPWEASAAGVIAVARKHLASPPPLQDADRRTAQMGFLCRTAASWYTLLETRKARNVAVQAVKLDPYEALKHREIRHSLTRWAIPRAVLDRRRPPREAPRQSP